MNRDEYIKSTVKFLVPVIFLFFCKTSFAQNSVSKNVERKIDEVFKTWTKPGSPGASIAVIQNGKVVFKKGYGTANLEYNIPISDSSVFNIASVSKQFTAFSILLLEQQSKLSLEDDVRKFIPELNDFGKIITLKHLASHTSGLKEFEALLQMAGWRQDDLIGQEDAMRIVLNQTNLDFDPGEQYKYSNTNYLLLAEVVSRVSGNSFAEFTRQNIFGPLGMKSTFFHDNHERIIKNLAHNYYLNNRNFVEAITTNDAVGSTNLYTNADDLALWALNFENHKIGNADIFKKMSTPGKLNNGSYLDYALGQYITPYKGLTQIQHSGSHRAYTSYLGRFPDQRFAVILLSNYDAINPITTSLKIADIFLGKYYAKPDGKENSKEAPKLLDPKSNPGKKTITYSFQQLKNFEGLFYSKELGTFYIIEIKNEKLFAKNIRYPDMEFIPTKTDEFTSGKFYFTKIKFIRNHEHNVVGFNSSNFRINNIYFEKAK